MLGERLQVELDEVKRFLAQRGRSLHIALAPRLDKVHVQEAEAAIRRSLPRDLVDFYTTFSNGFDLFWHHDPHLARFSMPALGTFVKDYCLFQSEVCEMLCNPHNFFDDGRIAEAKTMLKRMLNWAVLWEPDGTDDRVCIDLDAGTVLYHDREWLFCSNFATGSLIASSLTDMLLDWGRAGFLSFDGCPGTTPTPGACAVPKYPDLQGVIG
jgi:hypothetical protein